MGSHDYKICVAMPLYGASESAGIPKATLACLWYLGDHINSIVMGGTPGLNSNGCPGGGGTGGPKPIGSIVTLVQ